MLLHGEEGLCPYSCFRNPNGSQSPRLLHAANLLQKLAADKLHGLYYLPTCLSKACCTF